LGLLGHVPQHQKLLPHLNSIAIWIAVNRINTVTEQRQTNENTNNNTLNVQWFLDKIPLSLLTEAYM